MSRVRRRGTTIELTLSASDADIVRLLAEQVTGMLAGEEAELADPDPLAAMVGLSTEAVPVPEDPALQRLLPDAYADPTLATEFRRLTDADLRQQKVTALRRVIDGLGGGRRQTLSEDDAEAWLRGLNDIRLVLGVRLDVREDVAELFADLDTDDPRLPLLYAYERLTRLQDALVEALDGG